MRTAAERLIRTPHHAYRRVCALACVVLCTASTVQAQTQLNCGKPPDVFADIAKQFGERPAQVFVRDNGGQVMFLTVNPESGTWTLWAQQSADTICPVMGGDSWRDLTVPVKPERGIGWFPDILAKSQQ